MEERIGLCVKEDEDKDLRSLNPYCSGRKNRISEKTFEMLEELEVLILIVVEERIGL